MLKPAIPVHEDIRLEVLHQYHPLESFDERIYGPVLDLARDLFEVPTAFMSFVERHQQLLPVKRGVDLSATEREVSFCAHAIAAEAMLVVLDATLDPRFSDNPLVTGAPHIRFYAGAPLVSYNGHAIGTLCIADSKPRNSFGAVERRHLEQLAAVVLDRLELRRLEFGQAVNQVRFENIAATSPDGIICADVDGRITFWNAAAERLLGFSAAEAVGKPLDLIVPERMRKGHDGGLKRVAGGATPRLVGRTVELIARRKDATEFPIELSLSMWQETEGTNFGAILRDISERKTSEERLFRLAHHDPLTELPNRAVLRRRIDELANRSAGAALLLVDLDGFKNVNDELGHAFGDSVLRQVAERLVGGVHRNDAVARLGGDEFAVLLFGVEDRQGAAAAADVLINSLSRPISVGLQTVTISASIGIAIYPVDGTNKDDLLSNADLALYQVKHHGRHGSCVFTPSLRRQADEARAYDQELQRAFEQSEFEVFYQPQVRLADETLVGAEALLRWRHPRDGLLPPGAFMTALAGRPLSAEVGRWVLSTASAQAAEWRRTVSAAFRIGVNLFGSQFHIGDLAGDVRHVLEMTGLPGEALELEITEDIILRLDDTMLPPLRDIRRLGVGVAFDDYGTGYGSLSMLRRFPVTRLKIDKGFVRNMCEEPKDAAIVRSILFLGRTLGLEVIAEGVETAEQAARLRRKNCPQVQGYLFGRPMPAAEFAVLFNGGGGQTLAARAAECAIVTR
jgi:diguanylate cyclase (GGDEF)-like protein/PAS domain S-box-containing protein